MIFGGCADRLILFPTVIDARPLGPRRLMLPHEDGTLEIWTVKSQDPTGRGLPPPVQPDVLPPELRPATGPSAASQPATAAEPEVFVLTFNGNADRADRMVVAEAHLWSSHLVEVWAMNYPGYGLSTGPARLDKIGHAALATFDALKERAGDRPIIVSGMSLGSAAALYVAAQRDVQGVVLWNPPPLRQLILGRFGWWNLWLLAGPVALGVPPELDSLANARHAGAPALFVLSTHDEVVPYKYQQRVYDAYAGPKDLLTLGGGHNDALTTEAEREMRGKLNQLYRQAMDQQ